MQPNYFCCFRKPVGINMTLVLYKIDDESLQLSKVIETTVDRELVNDDEHEAMIVNSLMDDAVKNGILKRSETEAAHIQILE